MEYSISKHSFRNLTHHLQTSYLSQTLHQINLKFNIHIKRRSKCHVNNTCFIVLWSDVVSIWEPFWDIALRHWVLVARRWLLSGIIHEVSDVEWRIFIGHLTRDIGQKTVPLRKAERSTEYSRTARFLCEVYYFTYRSHIYFAFIYNVLERHFVLNIKQTRSIILVVPNI